MMHFFLNWCGPLDWPSIQTMLDLPPGQSVWVAVYIVLAVMWSAKCLKDVVKAYKRWRGKCLK